MYRLNFLKFIAFFTICLAACDGSRAARPSLPGTQTSLRSFSETPRELRELHSILVGEVQVDGSAHGCALGLDLTKELMGAFSREVGVELVIDKEASKHALAHGALASRADALGASAVLYTTLKSCERRLGSRIGVEDPAAVGMSFVLVRASDGKEIWRADYLNRDQALSENLLKLEERISNPGWRSAEQLFVGGLTLAARDLEQKRQEQFLGAVK